MKASTLRDFFLGKMSAQTLALDLRDAWLWRAPDVRELRMEDLDEDFDVQALHLAHLCDAVIAGDLPAKSLEAIGFGLIASDRFSWDTDTVDGARVGETLFDWSSPEVNARLAVDTARKFRARLLLGENHFTRDDHSSGQAGAPASSWTNKPREPEGGAG